MYQDIESLKFISEFIIVREHTSLGLGYFLERSKSGTQEPLEETLMFRPRMLKVNLHLHSMERQIEEDFHVIKTDIRSLCFLEGTRKLILELNGENLQILLFSIENKSLHLIHQEVDDSLGIKSISEKIASYTRKFCKKLGIQDDNEVKTRTYIDGLVHSYFILEHFEQSEYKNIRICDAVTGKSHNFRIYVNTIKRLHKEYISRVEDKIKAQLKMLFFQGLVDLMNFRLRLTRPLEDITWSEMSCNLSKNQASKGPAPSFQTSKFLGPSRESVSKDKSSLHGNRLSFSNKNESKFLSRNTREKTPTKRTSVLKSAKKSSIKKSKITAKEDLLNSKYMKAFRKKFSSTVKGLPSFKNASTVINHGSRDTSIGRGKSPLNSSRNKSKVINKSKRKSTLGHKKGSTFTHFPSKFIGQSTIDSNNKDLPESSNNRNINNSRRRSFIQNKSVITSKMSHVRNVSQIHTDFEKEFTKYEKEKPDVVGRFRQSYARTLTNFRETDATQDEFDEDDADFPLLEDLQELLEALNGKSR